MKFVTTALFCSLLMVGCSKHDVKDNLGLVRNAPDEFRVISHPPLEIPPAFTLKKPPSEEERLLKLVESNSDAEARTVLFNAAVHPGGSNVSDGELRLLGSAKTQTADPDIRIELKKAELEKAKDDASKNAIHKMVEEMQARNMKDESILDADAEEERLRKKSENQ